MPVLTIMDSIVSICGSAVSCCVSLPITYWQNGYVDVIRGTTISQKNSMVGDRVLGIEIKEPVFDIDYPDDVPRVEEGLRRLEEGQPVFDEDDTEDRLPV